MKERWVFWKRRYEWARYNEDQNQQARDAARDAPNTIAENENFEPGSMKGYRDSSPGQT